MDIRSAHAQEKIRRVLQQTLVDRCRRNPKYSLRAFSRALELEPAFLLKLISGKRSITSKSAEKISQCLGITLPELASIPNSESRESKFQDLRITAAQVVANWYHLAILELLEIREFKPSARSIAAALGITPAEAKAAVERLEELEMISTEGKGWKNISGNNSTLAMGTTSSSLRSLQKQILQQAMEALDEVPAEKRDQSTITMAIDTRLLPEAKEKLKKFRREFCEFLQKGRDCREVYQLSLSLFPLTRLENK